MKNTQAVLSDHSMHPTAPLNFPPGVLRTLLRNLLNRRVRLSSRISEEENLSLEVLALRRMFPNDPVYKIWYERHLTNCDRYQRQYDDLSRIVLSLKLQLYNGPIR